ncbi:DNA-formamidopyrimidine glycosylase family protein [Herbiconiux sp. 11R-BC]|uniref:DNA-formamidopyrimidine glycosylase family protein n=1 Tax=Herbiconiux sp. 11R-BC TaxID=3111637 RepID=UPI003C0B00B9
MPEGDTVYRTAVHLDEALRGRPLTVSDVRVPQFAAVDLRGEVVEEVVSRGKHLLTRVGAQSIHTHLKMEGSWHIYRHGTAWRRPAYQARIVLENTEWVTVGFDLGVVEVVDRDREDEVVGHLGPDLLGPDWNPEEAVRRLAAAGEREIDVALLDQRNLAGLGNEYVNELCFLRGVLPERPVSAVSDLPAVVALAHRLITANRDRVERTTTGDTRRGQQTWVYGREGRPCRRCGTRIRRGSLGASELTERVTYWCPRCQS